MASLDPIPTRTVQKGTRVVLITRDAPRAGIVSAVRLEPYLKTYIVECDDGSTVYASPYDLAREDDPTRSALGPRPEY